MKPEDRKRVEAATVRLPKLGGQGVLVPGGFVLTAAHCIEWDGRGGMALGDHYVETVETRSGRTFRMCPDSADLVSDMAALGALDNQMFYSDAEAFEAWADATEPVSLSGGFDEWCEQVGG